MTDLKDEVKVRKKPGPVPQDPEVLRQKRNARQRELRRHLKGTWDYKKYEKTKNGFLMRLYRNMQSRITGVQSAKHYLYEGKYLLPREEFYAWAKGSEVFHRLFEIWENSKYDRKLTPSVDRVDSSQGYYIWNMEWVTHSENSRRGSVGRYKRRS
jgi:hypothetical protein